jgi:hypothetical protein
LQLIDAEARSLFYSVTHINNMAAPFTVEEKFLAYHEFDKWTALHNGACVYECYAKVLDIQWGDIVEALVQIQFHDLPKRKYYHYYCMYLLCL